MQSKLSTHLEEYNRSIDLLVYFNLLIKVLFIFSVNRSEFFGISGRLALEYM